MANFTKLANTLRCARLGLVAMTAVIVPITATAQEMCGTDLFAGEPDAEELLDQTLVFLDTLETGGVVAFQGLEGRITIEDARNALLDGVGSASLLTCVVEAESIEFSEASGGHIISCDAVGAASLVTPISAAIPPPVRPWPVVGAEATAALGRSAGSLFCTTEVAALSQYMGSQA